MRRPLLALIVLVHLLATPALAVVCEITCVDHAAHETSHAGHAMASAPGHQEQQHVMPHHQAPDSSDAVSVRSHDCDHAALLPVLPEVVIGTHGVVLATVPSLAVPIATRASSTVGARPAAPRHLSVASPPLRI